MLSSKNFDLTQKIHHIDIFFCHHQFFFNTFKEALRYLFNVVILFNTVFYLKLDFKFKIDPKMYNFRILEEILKS